MQADSKVQGVPVFTLLKVWLHIMAYFFNLAKLLDYSRMGGWRRQRTNTRRRMCKWTDRVLVHSHPCNV